MMAPLHPGALGSALRYSYVSNGFVQHRLDDALEMLAENGYSGVGLVLDPHHFDPFASDLPARVAKLGKRLQDLNLSVAIETGASFLLDPRQKHEPTLVSAERRDVRVDLMKRAIAIAADLDAEVVSFWSGVVRDRASDQEAWDRLLPACETIIKEAERRKVPLGFEPEPGMFIDTLAKYEDLVARLGMPDQLGVTLDIGHTRCNEEQNEAASVKRAADRLLYVQIDDMRTGVHEHLDFGDGEVDFPSALHALTEIDYRGLVSVELSRHSHAANTVVPKAISFLQHAEFQY